jgi:phosphotransferase system  glucose/maltose/N-acetylglucosamine-specific IIC component
MCWNWQASAVFSAIGIVGTVFVQKSTGNSWLAGAIFYFTLMEILQVSQAWVVAESINDPFCRTVVNQVRLRPRANDSSLHIRLASPHARPPRVQLFTMLGFLHIIFQPYWVNIFYASYRHAWLGRVGASRASALSQGGGRR